MLQLMYCLRSTTIPRVEKMHSTVHCVLGVAKFSDTSQTLGNVCSTSDSFLPILDMFFSNFEHVFLQISACFLPILNMLFPNLDTFVFQILTCSFQILTCFFSNSQYVFSNSQHDVVCPLCLAIQNGSIQIT